MKLMLKFMGPNVVADTTKTQPIVIGHAISFTVDFTEPGDPTLDDAQRLFEMERTFNELTRGRLHVELVP